jgi:hypothetical protein
MDAKEKIKYVKNSIREVIKTSPSGTLRLNLFTVTHPDNEEWTLLSIGEQKRILQKLEENSEIKNLQFEGTREVLFEIPPKDKVPKKIRRSNILSHVKTIDQLMQHRELFEKFLKILGETKQLRPKHKYTFPTDEHNDDLIQLLIDLGLVEYDWNEMEKQTHRAVGNRIIEFSFESDKIIPLLNRITGKNGRIRKEALELISKDIGDRFTLNKIVEIFGDIGVPEIMFTHDTKWRAVFYVLCYYTTSKEHKDILMFLKILERFVHPLSFGGDETKAKETEEKYNKWLKYDRFGINDGKAFIGPTEEEIEFGADEWTNSDGESFEPKAFILSPDDLARLWVFWTQIVLIVSAYEGNQGLDRDELEKLYLELIAKTEQLLDRGDLGDLKQSYKRPFNSLVTAEIEARSKGFNSPYELAGIFLIIVGQMQPDATEIQKEREKHTDLIKRVASATRAISGEKINIAKLSYEQALFILKLYASYISSILEAVAGGNIKITDSELNAKYILFTDAVQEILNRDDFADLKKQQPDYLPEHLYIGADEMETWFEYGGQPAILSFIGAIESAWVRSGQQSFPISLALNNQLTETDDIISRHKKYKSEKWKQITKNLDGMKDEMFGGNGKKEEPKTEPDTPKKVIHEHLHRFENSIQEKDIAFNHTFFEGDTEGTVVKNKKKIVLPKFPATPYEQISIRFLTEQDVLITTPKKQLSSNYEALGFSNDKEKKPNTAWVLLSLLAKNGGEMKPPKPIPDTLRQQKRQLADQLKLIFKNSQDPFEDYSETSSYRLKIKLEVVSKDEAPDPLGTQEYLDETMTEETENYGRDFTQF